uniref:Non-haem dioxygenase N-terminal domain-containing protein n=1 Tax=Lactuca sativa TaxID=4236 RepID=A0A9R1XI84_LACSA|nr:hypothetical protein LSAT_V11C300109260 [Lactuca sativa]
MNYWSCSEPKWQARRCKIGSETKSSQAVDKVHHQFLKILPELFTQPIEKRLNMSKVLPDELIPVIDISDSEDPEVIKSVCDATDKLGLFQIVKHGVPLSIIEGVKDATHKFFGLSSEEKKKYLSQNTPLKNVRYVTSFSPEVDKAYEWKDHLSCFYVSDEETLELWPSICKHEALQYLKTCDSVIKTLIEILITGLGIPNLNHAHNES